MLVILRGGSLDKCHGVFDRRPEDTRGWERGGSTRSIVREGTPQAGRVTRWAAISRPVGDPPQRGRRPSKPGAAGPWSDHDAVLRIVWRPCNLGGEQALFECPRCSGEVRTVYAYGPTACRECHKLAYPSTREGPADRDERLAWRIYCRLTPEGERRQPASVVYVPVPGKPKGMHWRTYERLHREFRNAQMRALIQRDADVARALSPIAGEPWDAEGFDAEILAEYPLTSPHTWPALLSKSLGKSPKHLHGSQAPGA